MVRTARPSDVYRLPGDAPGGDGGPPEQDPGGSARHRVPGWLIAAGLAALVLVVSGVVRGATAPLPADAPIVDIVSEDQAIAALGLYDAQATTMDELRDRPEIFAPPGPASAAGVAGRGEAQVRSRLVQAREMAGADRLAAAYWDDAAHTQVVDQLAAVRIEGELLHLLAATHDTIYSGSGAIPLQEARQQLVSAFSTPRPEPLTAWANGLLDVLEDREAQQDPAQARERSADYWRSRIATLEPAATDALRDYVNGLPPTTLSGLRGNPVAGPAIRHLERSGRLVSTG